MKNVTTRQKEVYVSITRSVRLRGPSLTEISQDIKVSNKVAIGLLESLIKKGLVLRVGKHEYLPTENV